MTVWTPDQRSAAIARGLAVGADRASEQTGVPRRTISSWLARERPAPELDALIAAREEDTLDTLKAAAAEGAASLLAILRNPKAQDRDKVRAAEVALDRWNLLSGGVTGRTQAENLNVAVDAVDWRELEEAERYLRQLQDRIDAGDPSALDDGERFFMASLEARRAMVDIMKTGKGAGEARAIIEAQIDEARLSDG